MVIVRAAFALGVTALAVWLLLNGLPFGALVVVLLAIGLRRVAESGRLRRTASASR